MKPSVIVQEGSPYPLGATLTATGVNFAIFSASARKVTLCLFDQTGELELECIDIPFSSGFVWHIEIQGLKAGQCYGYRMDGPYEPRQGHRFNKQKLLIDPYAKNLVGTFKWSPVLYDYKIEHESEPEHVHMYGYGRGSEHQHEWQYNTEDSASAVPKCVVVDDSFDWEGVQRPNHPWHETIIYELHVKGFSQLNTAVPEKLRGTYLGLSADASIAHMKSLGITAVELLPCSAFLSERRVEERGLTNFWGYNTLAYFVPEPSFAINDSVLEFKQMVKGLHKAGIEVILDIVFNHTAEGDGLGPTLTFRGIDNYIYYKLDPYNLRQIVDYTGCGNTVNIEHPQVLKLVMDCLRYWVEEMHVDGFRFDLTTTLGRENGKFDPLSAFFDIIYQDPVLSTVKMIAEPWDLGPDGYQVGNYPTGWAEINDKFRDDIRAFWKGEAGMSGALSMRLAGSSDRFNRNKRETTASLNMIASHDGFTLHDVVCYETKHNEQNKENNRDGHSWNHSWNHGVEGPSKDPHVIAQREQQKRNLMATLLLAQGSVHVLAGDEIGRTQQGNNNAYCQDNEISWVNWDLNQQDKYLFSFSSKVIALRKKHPIFKRRVFFNGIVDEKTGLKDIAWIRPDGKEMKHHQWADPKMTCLGALLCGSKHDSNCEDDDDFLIIVNSKLKDSSFMLPRATNGGCWYLLFDTAIDNGAFHEANSCNVSYSYEVKAQSFVVMTALKQ